MILLEQLDKMCQYPLKYFEWQVRLASVRKNVTFGCWLQAQGLLFLFLFAFCFCFVFACVCARARGFCS